MRRRTGGVAVTAMVLTLATTPPLRAADEATAKQFRAKAEAARKTYEVFWKDYKEGLVPFTEVPYRWSRRWMKAELELLDAKADRMPTYQAHLERMRDLERKARDRVRIKVSSIDELSAAQYYVAEATAWVERAKPPK